MAAKQSTVEFEPVENRPPTAAPRADEPVWNLGEALLERLKTLGAMGRLDLDGERGIEPATRESRVQPGSDIAQEGTINIDTGQAGQKGRVPFAPDVAL